MINLNIKNNKTNFKQIFKVKDIIIDSDGRKDYGYP